MRKHIHFLFSGLILCFTTTAQPSLVFADGLGDINYLDQSNGLATDASGTSYIVGNFSGVADFDPSAGIANLTSAGNKDIFIAKYSSTGAYIWAIAIGGTLDDIGNGINLDANGNVFVTGQFKGNVDFDPSPGIATLNSSGNSDIFVAKYNSSGVYQWAISMGAVSDDIGTSLSNDAQGNCYVTGSFDGIVDFDYSINTSTLSSNGKDIFVAKYTTNGLYQWAFNIAGPGINDLGKSIKSDPSGNCYLTGGFTGTADFDASPIAAPLTSSGSNENMFVAKYSTGGAYQWAFSIPAISRALAIDPTGNVLITGTLSYSTVTDFDPSINVAAISTTNIPLTCFIAKYSTNGAYQWAFPIGSYGLNAGNAICTDAAGNCYVSGFFTYITDFDPSPAVHNVMGPNQGIEYVFVAKYDGSSNFQWAFRVCNTQSYNSNHGISTDAVGNTYVTAPQSPFYPNDYDPGPGTYSLATSKNIFFAKYTSCSAPPPPIVSPGNSQNVCANSSASLSALGTGTINWSTSPQSTNTIGSGTMFVTPLLSAGTHTFYASATTCTPGLNNTAITVTVYPLPNVNILNPTPIICRGQSATLMALGASTFTWNNSASSASLAVNPIFTGSYTVTGSDLNSCTNTAVTTVTVGICTGLDETVMREEFLIYPNPAQDFIKIEIDNKYSIDSAYLLNSLGQKTDILDFIKNNEIVDVSNLKNGVYFLQFKKENSEVSTRRFVIVR